MATRGIRVNEIAPGSIDTDMNPKMGRPLTFSGPVRFWADMASRPKLRALLFS